MAALEPKFWDRFCELAGCAELSGSEAERDLDRTASTLKAIFSSRTLDEWKQLSVQWDVCIGPVLTPEEAIDAEDLPLFAGFDGPMGETSVLAGALADLAHAAPATCPPHPVTPSTVFVRLASRTRNPEDSMATPGSDGFVRSFARGLSVIEAMGTGSGIHTVASGAIAFTP